VHVSSIESEDGQVGEGGREEGLVRGGEEEVGPGGGGGGRGGRRREKGGVAASEDEGGSESIRRGREEGKEGRREDRNDVGIVSAGRCIE